MNQNDVLSELLKRAEDVLTHLENEVKIGRVKTLLDIQRIQRFRQAFIAYQNTNRDS